MGGFLYYRGGYCEASGSQIPDRGDPPQASCSRTGYSDSQIRREGCIHLPLPPRARVRSSPLHSRPHVLLWARFSRSSSRLFSPHLGVRRCVRSLSPHPPHFGLWLKTFNVKPKMIEGRHAECGGAVISKSADVPWTEGSFPEVSSLWQ